MKILDFLRQLYLLLWKNFTLRRRSIVILIFYYQFYKKKEKNETQFFI
jgi:hypothetical protein